MRRGCRTADHVMRRPVPASATEVTMVAIAIALGTLTLIGLAALVYYSVKEGP